MNRLGFTALLAYSLATGMLHAGQDALSPIPLTPSWQTDARHCEWVWREGGSLGLWTETCTLQDGRWDVVWDETQAAFVSRRNGETMGVVVQILRLPGDQDPERFTASLQKAGLLGLDADCAWERITLWPATPSMTFSRFAPLAPDALAMTPQGEVPEPQCGPYGHSTHGVRYFIQDQRWPDRVIFVDEGQERGLFDIRSVTLLPQP